jgi:hypothetical protein
VHSVIRWYDSIDRRRQCLRKKRRVKLGVVRRTPGKTPKKNARSSKGVLTTTKDLLVEAVESVAGPAQKAVKAGASTFLHEVARAVEITSRTGGTSMATRSGGRGSSMKAESARSGSTTKSSKVAKATKPQKASGAKTTANRAPSATTAKKGAPKKSSTKARTSGRKKS